MDKRQKSIKPNVCNKYNTFLSFFQFLQNKKSCLKNQAAFFKCVNSIYLIMPKAYQPLHPPASAVLLGCQVLKHLSLRLAGKPFPI